MSSFNRQQNAVHPGRPVNLPYSGYDAGRRRWPPPNYPPRYAYPEQRPPPVNPDYRPREYARRYPGPPPPGSRAAYRAQYPNLPPPPPPPPARAHEEMYAWPPEGRPYRPVPPPRRDYPEYAYDPYRYSPYRERRDHNYGYYEEDYNPSRAYNSYEPLNDTSRNNDNAKYAMKHDESITTMDVPPQINHKNGDLASQSSSSVDSDSYRILCIADVKGKLTLINELAEKTGASIVIHTGDFGFFDHDSVGRIAERSLVHLVQYSPFIDEEERNELLTMSTAAMRQHIFRTSPFKLSQLPDFLVGDYQFNCPVYTTYGAAEDVSVLERFRSGDYRIKNLHILDESNAPLLNAGGLKVRLFGLGGSVIRHKLFDNGDGIMTIAGGGGMTWTTLLQIGELMDTAKRVSDSSEVRLLVTHANPGREAVIAQLALSLLADYSISGGLHFRNPIIWNPYSVHATQMAWRDRIMSNREMLLKIWRSVKEQVESNIDEYQKSQLDQALSVIQKVPPVSEEDRDFQELWCANLTDAEAGHLLFIIQNGRISLETRAQGLSFAHRMIKNEYHEPGMSSMPNTITFKPPPASGGASSHVRKESIKSREKSLFQSTNFSDDENDHKPSIKNPQMKLIQEESIMPTQNPALGRRATPVPASPVFHASLRNSIAKTPLPAMPTGLSTPKLTRPESRPKQPEVNDNNAKKVPISWADVPEFVPSAKSYVAEESEEEKDKTDAENADNAQEEEVDQLSLWVGGFFDTPVSEAEILEFFGGEKSGIREVKLLFDQNAGRQRPFCFVHFENVESMQMAADLNGTLLKGRPIRIRLANLRTANKIMEAKEALSFEELRLKTLSVAPPIQEDPEGESQDNENVDENAQDDDTLRIWLGGLYNETVTELEIRSFFGPLSSKITSVKLLYNFHTGMQRPFCFVDFDSEEAVIEAMKFTGKILKSNVVKINRANEHLKTQNSMPSLVNYAPAIVNQEVVAPTNNWQAAIEANNTWPNMTKEEAGLAATTLPNGWIGEMMQHGGWPAAQVVEIPKQQALPNPNTLWLGGFYNDTLSEDEVRQFFGPLARHIVKVKLMYDKVTGKQRAFCFVEFDNQQAVEEGLLFSGRVMKNHIIKLNRAVIRNAAIIASYEAGLLNNEYTSQLATPHLDTSGLNYSSNYMNGYGWNPQVASFGTRLQPTAPSWSPQNYYTSNMFSGNVSQQGEKTPVQTVYDIMNQAQHQETENETENLKESNNEQEEEKHLNPAAYAQTLSANATPVPEASPFTLWVGGLANEKVTEKDIRKFLGPEICEGVTNVKFLYDRKSHKLRPFCFVDFANNDYVTEALKLNGKMLKTATIKMNRAEYKNAKNANNNSAANHEEQVPKITETKADFADEQAEAKEEEERRTETPSRHMRANTETYTATPTNADNSALGSRRTQSVIDTSMAATDSEMYWNSNEERRALNGSYDQWLKANVNGEHINDNYVASEYLPANSPARWTTNGHSEGKLEIETREIWHESEEQKWEENYDNKDIKQEGMTRTLWIGGLFADPVEEADFKEWFRGVEKVHFLFDRESGERRNFCYIDFVSPQYADDALMYNGQQFKGNKLKMRPTPYPDAVLQDL